MYILTTSLFLASVLFSFFRGFAYNQIFHTGILYLCISSFLSIFIFVLQFYSSPLSIKRDFYAYYLACFFCLIIFCISYSYYSLPFNEASYCYLYAFIIMPILLSLDIKFERKLVFFYLVLVCFFLFSSLYQFISLDFYSLLRYRGINASVNQFAANQIPILSLSLELLLLYKSKFSRFFILLFFIISLVCLLISGSRGALLLFILYLCIRFFKPSSILKLSFNKSIFTVIFSFLLSLSFIFISLWDQFIYPRFIDPLFSASSDLSVSHLTRIEYFSIFFDQFLSSLPVFFIGNSPGVFTDYTGDYPHNFFLEYYSDLGIFFSIVFSAIFIIPLYRSALWLRMHNFNDPLFVIIFSSSFSYFLSTLYTAQASLTIQMPVMIVFLIKYNDFVRRRNSMI